MAEYIENGKIQIYNKFNEWLCRRSLRGREVNLTSGFAGAACGAAR